MADHRGVVGSSDPDADGVVLADSDGPGVAVAVAGAGFYRQALLPSGVFLAVRQHVADDPGRAGAEQPFSCGHVVRRESRGDDLACVAEGAVECDQVFEIGCYAAKGDREVGPGGRW